MSHKFRTFSPCSEIATREVLWVPAKDGKQVKIQGTPEPLAAYEIAWMYADKYQGENLPPTFTD